MNNYMLIFLLALSACATEPATYADYNIPVPQEAHSMVIVNGTVYLRD